MYDMSVSDIRGRIRQEHKSGIRQITYGKFQFCGGAGFEFARRHPQWVVYRSDGAFQIMFWELSPLDLAKPITEKMPSYMQGTVNFYDPEAVRFGAEEIVRGAKMMGFDGVWFDGHFFVFPGFDYEMKPTKRDENPNLLGARNVRLCRQIIRKEFPNFAFYYNGIDKDFVSLPHDNIRGKVAAMQSRMGSYL